MHAEHEERNGGGSAECAKLESTPRVGGGGGRGERSTGSLLGGRRSFRALEEPKVVLILLISAYLATLYSAAVMNANQVIAQYQHLPTGSKVDSIACQICRQPQAYDRQHPVVAVRLCSGCLGEC